MPVVLQSLLCWATRLVLMLRGKLWPEYSVFHICGTGTLTGLPKKADREGGGGEDEEDNRNRQLKRGLSECTETD